ncbi:MAG: hypothetical protein KDA37_02550 [Planctomycetales bacterium]|nr:hypothetical protein [Planctomycetales bacterium]
MLPVSGMIIGGLFLSGAWYFLWHSIQVRNRFPGLNDPSPETDDYWPAVEVQISEVFAAIGSSIGVPVFLLSLAFVWIHFRKANK